MAQERGIPVFFRVEDVPVVKDPFIGTWELDPTTLDYEFGKPGRRATYIIEPIDEGLRFTLDADDPEGKRLNFVYGGRLDGSEQPLQNTDALLVLTRIDGQTIESVLKSGGKIVDCWTRELLPDLSTMKITQHGKTPTGTRFRNTGLYRRIA
ncbi:MAG: hypothetical protein NVS9B15_15640 [Acidobacteriaceae bacterium]